MKSASLVALFTLLSLPASAAPLLHTFGRSINDTCGYPLTIRGVEAVLGFGLEVNDNFADVIGEIGKTGANAVRMLPNISQLAPQDLEPALARAAALDLVVYLSPGDRTWFGRSDVKALVARYQPFIIIDAFQEATYDDPVRWLADAQQAVRQIRGYGYGVPLNVISNQYGRDVVTLLKHGAEVVAADPLHNTILGWQAYWGSSGWYQQASGLSLTQAVQAVHFAPFPVQIGLDYVTDYPSETMNFAAMMSLAQLRGVSWLWWDWRLPADDTTNDLSLDGTFAHLTSLGQQVVNAAAGSLRSTPAKACRPAGF